MRKNNPYVFKGPLFKVKHYGQTFPRCVVLDGPDKGTEFVHGRKNNLLVVNGMVTANEALIAGNSIVGVKK